MSIYVTEGNNDVIDRFIYPYLQRLDQYIPQEITPNMLTGIGLCGSFISSLSLIFISSRIAYVFAVFGLVIWIIFDGLDGVHARNNKKSSIYGMFFDHFCDQISMLAIFFSVMLRFDLMSELFIFIFLLRIMTNTLTFMFQASYGVLFLPKMGLSCEMFIYSLAFLFLFFFQDISSFSLQFFGSNTAHFNLIKLMALAYLYILPRTWLSYFQLAKASSKM
jgi:phosphatidylglycerophosphate synthase